MKKTRHLLKKKKGAAILEFMIIMPFFMAIMWLTMQFTFFIVAINTNYQASIEASKVVSSHMRGKPSTSHPGNLPNKVQLNNDIKEGIKRVMGHNSLIELNEVIDAAPISYENTTNVSLGCTTVPKNSICVASDDRQFKVVINTNFKIQGLEDFLGADFEYELLGTGVTQRELTNRYNYN